MINIKLFSKTRKNQQKSMRKIQMKITNNSIKNLEKLKKIMNRMHSNKIL